MRSRWPRVALPLALLAVAGSLDVATRRIEQWVGSPHPLMPTPRFDPRTAALAVRASDPPGGFARADVPVEVSFEPGETVGEVLRRLGFSDLDATGLIAELGEVTNLRRLRPEDRYALLGEDGAQPRGFRLTLAGRGRATVVRRDGGWERSWQPFRRSVRVDSVEGTLESSLEGAIRGVGGEPQLAYRMADVLQWDLDFNRDLRKGDWFEVLYERVYLDGAFDGVGQVLAMSYENGGKRFEAYRFGAENAYYDAAGRPLRKMFLKSPLPYSRVTSRFSQRRFHPILKRYRPHYGVDYGAPQGTPVRVTAGGVVTFTGWDGGGGKTVKVRHPNGFLTAYLHLSRFADGVRSGRRVSQGQVIGYVGSTGLATASHLDYRVQRNGRWIDPLRLKSEPAEPVPAERLAEFEAWRDRLREALRDGAIGPLSVPGEDLLAAVEPAAAETSSGP